VERLHTERLDLEPCTADDVEQLHALWRRPEVRLYLWDDVAISHEQAREAVEALVESAASRGCGLWKIHRTGQAQLIGFCALREIAGTDEIEIIYGLAPEAWGQGLATEAASAVMRYGFEELQLARIWGRTDPPNLGSQRVIERLGMRPAPNPGHETTPMVSFVLERPA
jgi:ribosomal-protein-alanine N-acetyltransferase